VGIYTDGEGFIAGPGFDLSCVPEARFAMVDLVDYLNAESGGIPGSLWIRKLGP